MVKGIKAMDLAVTVIVKPIKALVKTIKVRVQAIKVMANAIQMVKEEKAIKPYQRLVRNKPSCAEISF